MCFPKAKLHIYQHPSQFNANEMAGLKITICSDNLFSQMINVYEDNGCTTPILVVGNNKKSELQAHDKQFTTDFLPMDLLSPAILKMSINSLLRDFVKNQKLVALAHYDNLTGAANRHLFTDRLKQALENAKRHHQPISLAYFDLDKFKPVNDTYGHHVGDELLKTFVQRVKDQLRKTDTLGRLGGDEFALLLPLTDLDEAEFIIQRVLESLIQPLEFEGIKLSINTSIGLIGSKNGLENEQLKITDLMKEVDQATYCAKAEGKHSYVIKEISTQAIRA
ncbi:diguanylate cyclase domain-containing protein [Oceanospirillum sediminis]|uniref:GGDEF domain-containing protein n=1 Tax=Oceanospirillum sediminis TaxID=2760088 RepID=A0A839ITA5_9GAMM|nr:GGDEF domain-containing protein [Oceanospirillum sediminis]MBB1487862.1 GGDEF domain-containing protein [Oceanospirillum sediminis]